ncbi:MAG TPA: flagellar biosynthesis anti-sigma factor FlgM [Smithellaceae bacterium]|nr:flagellar biosynthesis anti-sigma factor FlgM [Smithellaceae bacterium]
MKISDVKDISAQMVQQYQKNESITVTSDKQAANKGAGTGEKVDLSTQAKTIQQIKEVLSGVPDVREEKVQEIKSQVQQGIYEINGDKIAEKMVAESIIDIFA